MSWKTVKTPPDSDRPVLALLVGNSVPEVARLWNGKWMNASSLCDITKYVTHWHPLPKAPK